MKGEVARGKGREMEIRLGILIKCFILLVTLKKQKANCQLLRECGKGNNETI